MYFKSWNYTTCIRSDNLAAIEQATTDILEQEEGCRRLPRPFQRTSNIERISIHPEGTVRDLWIVGLFSGSDGWTIIKTWPYELLCQRARGINHPRLSELSIQLNCDAFHFRVSIGVNVLLEVDANGCIFISGWPGSEGPARFNKFYDEPMLQLEEFPPRFFLLQVSEPMQAAMRVNEDPEWLRKEAEVKKMIEEKVDFEQFPDWFDWDEFSKSYLHRIGDALAKVVGGSSNYWYLNNLAYRIYNDPKEFEIDGVRLLYFQPPITYNPIPDNMAHANQPDTAWERYRANDEDEEEF